MQPRKSGKENTLKQVGTIPNARARGAAVDPKSHHGFCSSSPVVMWDTTTLKTIKTIDVQGRPDGILFEPATERVYVFSHSAPNATVIDAKNNQIILITTEPAPAPQAAADATARSASVTTTATPATPAAGADQPGGGRRGGRGGGGGPGLLDILVVGQ